MNTEQMPDIGEIIKSLSNATVENTNLTKASKMAGELLCKALKDIDGDLNSPWVNEYRNTLHLLLDIARG